MTWKPLALLAVIVLIFTPLVGTSLIVSAQNAPVVYHWPSNYHFQPPTGYDIFWSQTIYSTDPSYSVGTGTCNCINFTNAYFTSGVTQNIVTGVENGNTTITNIQANQVNLECAFTNSYCSTLWYYGSSVPTEVELAGNPTITFLPSSWTTSYSAYSSSTSPIVYQNQTGNYLEIKSFTSNQEISVYTSSTTTTTTCTSGCGGGGSSTTTTTTITISGSNTTYGGLLKASSITLNLKPGQSQIASSTIDNTGDSSPTTINSITITAAKGITISSNYSSLEIPAFEKTTLPLNITALPTDSPGQYVSTVQLSFTQASVTNEIAFQVVVNVGSTQSTSFVQFLTDNALIIAIIIAIAGPAVFIVKKQAE